MQTQTLSAVFETYFRILKHTLQSLAARCVLIHIMCIAILQRDMDVDKFVNLVAHLIRYLIL